MEDEEDYEWVVKVLGVVFGKKIKKSVVIFGGELSVMCNILGV